MSRRGAGTTGPQREWVTIYDGSCGVCARSVALLRRWDGEGRIEIVAAQDPSVPSRFPWIPADAYARAMQVVGPGGVTREGAAAVGQLLDLLPRGRLLSWAFRAPLLGALLDRGYRWFARHRQRFGCAEHCSLTPPSAR